MNNFILHWQYYFKPRICCADDGDHCVSTTTTTKILRFKIYFFPTGIIGSKKKAFLSTKTTVKKFTDRSF